MKQGIERQALAILMRLDIDEVPVPIDYVARQHGLRVAPAHLGDDISGVLVVSNGKGAIGYNPGHPLVRRRFTIAHELGHFVLHKDKPLFVDEISRFTVMKRDGRSATGDDHREREANAFAASILMPKHILEREFYECWFNLTDEDALRTLASKFQVSMQAMSIRLANTHLLTDIF